MNKSSTNSKWVNIMSSLIINQMIWLIFMKTMIC